MLIIGKVKTKLNDITSKEHFGSEFAIQKGVMVTVCSTKTHQQED